MRVNEFVPFESLEFQTGNVSKLRVYNESRSLFGLGQEDVVSSKIKDLRTVAEKYAVTLVVVGVLVGIVGTIPLKETPFGPIVSTAGGFIMAAGLVPIILGAL